MTILDPQDQSRTLLKLFGKLLEQFGTFFKSKCRILVSFFFKVLVHNGLGRKNHSFTGENSQKCCLAA